MGMCMLLGVGRGSIEEEEEEELISCNLPVGEVANPAGLGEC